MASSSTSTDNPIIDDVNDYDVMEHNFDDEEEKEITYDEKQK